MRTIEKISLSLASIALSSLAFGATLVAPGSNSGVAGNAQGTLPTAAESIEIQEAIGSGQFPSSPIAITAISFRAAPGTGPINGTIGTLTVTLSTSPNFPNTNGGKPLLSATFANNVGPDKTIVFSGSNIPLKDAGCASPGPCPFDITITFQTPFVFSASKGALLVDLVETNLSGSGATDAESFSAPGGSVAIVAGAAGSPTGTFAYEGNIAQITFTTTAPQITGVENAASNIPPGLPNAGIAQGAIFSVYGSGLGPANLATAPAAFQSTTLSGTSVAVTVGSTAVNALMYYTSDGQVAALLPSSTPTGAGSVAVTYNGQTAQAPITIVTNNLGIFSIDSSGGGPGIVTYADYSLVSPDKAANCGGPNTVCGAANPGDTLILWATGLGPASSDDAAGLGENMPNIPLKLWLGGIQAPVSYQGRSGCCVGEDQIVFTVPDNVPTGCAVPLLVQIGDQISNNTVIPVADGSRTCPLSNSSLASLGTQKIEEAVSAGAITFGEITLAHNSQGGGAFKDVARFQFLKAISYVPGTQPFFASSVDDQPSNACIVYNNTNASFTNPITGGNLIYAGPSFTVTGPNGSVAVPVNGGNRNVVDPMGAFLVPGGYTITGDRGADVGTVSASITIPAAATLTSPVNNGTATRANGMTVTWTGGSGDLKIYVISCSDPNCNNGAAAVCIVPASPGTFDIPPYVLEALPAGSVAGVVLDSYSNAAFTATGLNLGTVGTHSDVSGFGPYWGSGGFTLK